MKQFRVISLVLGLAAALSQGCGGDSTDKGPGGGTGATAAMGSGGGTSSGPASCTSTRCMMDPDYSRSQAYCDGIERICGAESKAEVACALANDTCKADGNQDYAKVQAACGMQIDALAACLKAHQ